MLDLEQLRSFVAVVDAGSFTAAGRALGLTKAAVSQHVRKLEDAVGCALLMRTTRRASPTDEGARLHASATGLLASAERIETEVRMRHTGLTGTLRLTATNEYMAYVLTPMLASFVRAHPRLRIEASGSAGFADLVAERFDVAVRFGRLPDSGLQATKIGSFRLIAVATPALLERVGIPHDPASLVDLPWVLHAQHAPTLTWRRGEETRDVTLPGRVRTDAGETNRRLALDGIGAVLAADWRIGRDLATGRLVRLVPGWSLDPLAIHAVRAATSHVPAKVRALIAHLQQGLDGAAPTGAE